MTLAINSHFLNNSIVIIKSLEAGEEDTATTLYNHLVSISKPESPILEFHDAISKQHVLDILDDVKEKAKTGMKPIVHFETHGNKDLGLHISATGEFISWQELADKFREINVISNNNLGIVMAACFGLYAIRPIKIFDPSPFFILISSDEEIDIDYINSQIWMFYDTLFSSGNIEAAMAAIDEQFTSFYAERFFTVSVIKYFKDECTGKGFEERVARLVTDGLHGIKNPNAEQIETLRKSAEEFVKPNPQAFNRISEKFIIDKSKYTVSFEEIMGMVSAAV